VPNRLAHETSPYLLQHAHNPVDWYPWGEEALAQARAEDRPILLSIGYSACHWCHVMERESFEDPRTAAQMNRAFVNIKVDREERPDLDSIYMRGVQLLTGGGGWPLTAFLAPDGRLFHGGTYFPPESRYGMPSFRQVLAAVEEAWRDRRGEVERGSRRILEVLRGGGRGVGGGTGDPGQGDAAGRPAPGPGTLEGAFRFLARRFHAELGGFGPPPKFPQPENLELLLRHFRRTGSEVALDMALVTLRAMARGGIRDHLGGGFHRYSVDARWLVPHFEKMLYDNGLLARAYLHAFQLTGDEEMGDAATSTLDYVLEDLTSPEGGFHSARDADSDGEEGLFYVWTPAEVEALLGPGEGALFRRAYDVSEAGNFEGRNILHLPHPLEAVAHAEGIGAGELRERLARSRRILKEARSGRTAPFRDEKVLVSWNSFVLRALAEAGAALGRADYLAAARRNAAFLLGSLRRGERLLRSWKDGPGRVEGFLEDYAGLGNALLTLHEATLEARWLEEALRLAEQVVALFWEEGEGRFYDAPRDGEALVVRPRDPMDNATPSGNSLAVELLLRVAHLTSSDAKRAIAARVLEAERGAMEAIPSAFGHLLSALDRHETPPLEVVLVGGSLGDPALQALLARAWRPYLPNRVVAGGEAGSLPALPLLEGRSVREGRATAYVCRAMTCSAPLHDPAALGEEMERG
jgi:hypothetical protein